MPISRDEAAAAASTRDHAPYDQLCKMVDGAITHGFGTSRLMTIAVSGFESHIVTKVIETYTRLGWDCRLVPDQREGDYLQLN